MRHLICWFIVLPAMVFAQDQPILKTTTSEVMFDLVVRDKKARIVRDLKPEEIQVFEDGVPQTIRHFEFLDGRLPGAGETTVAAVPETAPANAATAPAGATAAPLSVNTLRQASVVSVVIADLTAEGRKEAIDAMKNFLGDEKGPDLYVGVFRIWGRQITPVQAYTNDEGLISKAIHRAVMGAGSADDPDVDNSGIPQPVAPSSSQSDPSGDINITVENAMSAESADAYQGSVAQLSIIRRLIQAQAALPGRKVVLLFIPGLQAHPDTMEILQSAISVANRANVTVYAWDSLGYRGSDLAKSNQLLSQAAGLSRARQLNPSRAVTTGEAQAMETAERSISANTRGALEAFAEATGGALLANGKDLRGQFQRAMEDVRTHYELTYAPTNPNEDGRFRKIEVKVARPGTTVFARSGYYALPLVNGREVYPFELATLGALNATPPPHQFEFHSAALRFRPETEKTRYAFVFQAPMRHLTINSEGKWAAVHVSITALVKDAEGRVVDKISKDIPYQMPANRIDEMRQGAVSFTQPFTLPPGRYTIETAVLDRQSGKASVRRSVLVVEPAPAGLATSDVTLVRRVSAVDGPPNSADPLQARGGQVLPELSNTVAFAPGDSMSFYAVAYPPQPVEGPVEMSLDLTRDGQTVVHSAGTAVQLEQNGAASVLASFPADKVQPGYYEARVTFSYGGRMTTSETTVTVEAGQSSPEPEKK